MHLYFIFTIIIKLTLIVYSRFYVHPVLLCEALGAFNFFVVNYFELHFLCGRSYPIIVIMIIIIKIIGHLTSLSKGTPNCKHRLKCTLI